MDLVLIGLTAASVMAASLAGGYALRTAAAMRQLEARFSAWEQAICTRVTEAALCREVEETRRTLPRHVIAATREAAQAASVVSDIAEARTRARARAH